MAKRRLWILLILIMGGTGSATQAQQKQFQSGSGTVSIAPGGAAYFQTFDSLSTGTSTSSNSLPIGWYVFESGTGGAVDGKYIADDGGNPGGNIYAYGTGTQSERALGMLQSGTLAPTIGVRFTNNTGATLSGGNLSYFAEFWRRGDTGRSDRLDFQYSTNATSLSLGTWVDVSALGYSSPAGSTTGSLVGNANRTQISGTLSGLSVADGGDIWFRWVDFPLSGANDGIAVDDLSFTPNTPVPEPATIGLVAAAGLGAVTLIRRSRRAKHDAA
jgi:hypothetical protein